VRDSFSLAAAFGLPGAVCYVASPSGDNLPLFIRAIDGSGFRYRHSLVWVKDAFVLGRADYHYRHETILYGWQDGAGHFFVDDRKQDSVFEVAKPKDSPEHPTMKPPELIEPMVANSSKPGEIVFDPFLGSGSTLIACERMGRRCRGIEIAPGYVDVTVRRWQTMTGKRAVLEATGEEFPEGDRDG